MKAEREIKYTPSRVVEDGCDCGYRGQHNNNNHHGDQNITQKCTNVPIGGGVQISNTAGKVKLGGSVERKEWTPGAGQNGGGGRGQG